MKLSAIWLRKHQLVDTVHKGSGINRNGGLALRECP